MPVSDTISHCNLAQLLNEGGLDVHFPSVSFGNETTLGSWSIILNPAFINTLTQENFHVHASVFFPSFPLRCSPCFRWWAPLMQCCRRLLQGASTIYAIWLSQMRRRNSSSYIFNPHRYHCSCKHYVLMLSISFELDAANSLQVSACNDPLIYIILAMLSSHLLISDAAMN